MAGSGLDSGGSKTVGDGAEGGRGPGQTQLCTHNTLCYTCIMHDMSCWTCCRRFARTFCALSLFIFKSSKTGHSGFSIIKKTSTITWKTGHSGFSKCQKPTCFVTFVWWWTRENWDFENTDIQVFEELKTWHSGFWRIENMTFRFSKSWKQDQDSLPSTITMSNKIAIR